VNEEVCFNYCIADEVTSFSIQKELFQNSVENIFTKFLYSCNDDGGVEE
jgi:hypothetical protein